VILVVALGAVAVGIVVAMVLFTVGGQSLERKKRR